MKRSFSSIASLLLILGGLQWLAPVAHAVGCNRELLAGGSGKLVMRITTSYSDGGACLDIWTVPTGVTSVEVLAVGGGGGGGTSRGGGGGAGGVAYTSNLTVTPGGTFNANIGGGGAAGSGDARGTTGTDTSFVRNSDGATTVIGGGGGGGGSHHGSNPSVLGDIDGGAGRSVSTSANVTGGAAAGGSGGGAAMTFEYYGRQFGRGGNAGNGATANGSAGASGYYCPYQTGTAGVPFNNRRSTGGGGGAGHIGYGYPQNPDVGYNCDNWSSTYKPHGGNGTINAITGSNVEYGGGGGGANALGNGETAASCSAGICSLGRGTPSGGGGGGHGQSYFENGVNVNYSATNGEDGKGGGGGGGIDTAARGGAGVLIIAYKPVTTQPFSTQVAVGSTGFTLSAVESHANGEGVSYQWWKKTIAADTEEPLSETEHVRGTLTATLRVGSSTDRIVTTDAGLYYLKITYSGAGDAIVQSDSASVVVSILDESFRQGALANSSDWEITYINSNYANNSRTGAAAGTYSNANEYFQPCLTASNSNATTVTSGGTEATVGASTSKTVATLGSCNNSAIDALGNGALRLSSMRLDTRASAVYKKAISVTSGLDITFNYASYSGFRGYGTNGPADGSSFYLKKGTSTDYTAGGGGGAVGYARRATSPVEEGVDQGLLAIGFDIYGNVNQTNHVGTDCAAGSITDFAGTTYTATAVENGNNNRVKILGPTGSTRQKGYCAIAASGTTLSSSSISGPSIASPNVTFSNLSTTTRNNAVSHVIRILLEPTTISNPKLYVIVDGTIRYEIAQPQAYKDAGTFKFGFSSATGGSSTITEFWSTAVKTYDGVTPPDAPDSVTTSAINANGSQQTISWNAPNFWGVGELAAGAGGAVSRSYRVNLIDSNGNESGYTCTTTNTSCNIVGISEGVYTAQVYAINRTGVESIASDGSATFTSTLAVVSTCGSGLGQLQNGSFEQPAGSSSSWGQTEALFFPDATAPGYLDSSRADNNKSYWINTDTTSHRIELGWGNGVGDRKSVEGNPLNGVAGRFSELNADNFGGLYQDVATVPGVTYKWKLWHGSRVNATESMKLLIGSTSGTTSYTGGGASPTTVTLPGTLTAQNGTRAARAYQIFRKSISSNVATLTTGYNSVTLVAHNIANGDTVTVSGLGSPFDGSFTVTATTTNTFSYSLPNSTDVATADIPAATHAFVQSTNATNTVTTATTEFSDDTNSWGRWEGTYLIPAGQTTTRFLFTAFTPGTGSVGNYLDNIAFAPTAACPDRGLGLASVSKSYSVLSNDLGSNIGIARIIAASFQSGACTSACISFTSSAITVRPLSTFRSTSSPIVVRYTMQIGDDVTEIASGTLTVWGADNRAHTKYVVDPRRTYVDIKGIKIDTSVGSDSDEIRACVNAANSAGSDDNASNLVLDVSTKGSTDTTFATNSPISGDRSRSITLDGPSSNVTSLIGVLRVSLSTGAKLNTDYYIRVRSVASQDSCANAAPGTNDKLMLITPLYLTSRRTVSVTINKGGPR